ncbi:DgyrCDS9173 [Dimorphilus gyrociliatus]|uniref:DgyrCDS9173 n=1 Tax=Dimorphilus gyrociliatus TaxID=2664684 RepID=A0A7I8VYL7_9ANNE|nr:DgyrCDS9173 [Dimorphilus gyrociliatus]
MKLVIASLLVCLALALGGERKRYDGYQLIKLTPTTKQQLDVIRQFEDSDKFIFLSDIGNINSDIYVIVHPDEVSVFVSYISAYKIQRVLENPDIQQDLDSMWERLDSQKAFDINDYNRLEDIEAQIDVWNNACVSGFECSIENLGNSYEGRPIKLLKIEKAGENRKIMWMDSTIHAREWLAPATVLKIANAIFTGENADATRLLNTYDWYFVFVMNPDGYVYTWDGDRFWRKSRNPNAGSSCIGTDLNRNYDYRWGFGGSSTNPCSTTYRGTSAGSEPETKAVQTKALAIGSRVLSWVSVHTSGNMWLSAFGYLEPSGVCGEPTDYNDIYSVAEATAEAVMDTFGTTWTYGSACTTIYPASGITVDYTYGAAGIKYSYTPELRGPGFNPGPNAITPSYQEVWNGIVAMIRKIEEIENNK